MLLAGVFVAAGGRGPRFDRTEEAFGGAFFAFFGAVCVYGAWVMYSGSRAAGPSRLRGSSLAVQPDELRRGEELSVTFTGRGSEDDQLEVGLVCVERFDQQVRVYNRGASTVVRQTAEATVHQEWRPVEPVGERTFSFQIPSEAPYSYEGECVSYVWQVSARAVKRLRKDPRLDHPIWVRT